jgi:hypothetical protein
LQAQFLKVVGFAELLDEREADLAINAALTVFTFLDA